EKLVVGKVDSAIVLQSDPDYMPMAQQYLREQTELRSKTYKEAMKLKGKTDALQKLQAQFMEEQKALTSKWQKTTQDFLTTRNSKMRQMVEDICKDKHIDMVLIDSKEYATVEWGAVDITPDVLLKTSGGAAAPAAGSSTPKGDSK
ncbi:unnamed protein product, partial [Phaeothamnion confervicola]